MRTRTIWITSAIAVAVVAAAGTAVAVAATTDEATTVVADGLTAGGSTFGLSTSDDAGPDDDALPPFTEAEVAAAIEAALAQVGPGVVVDIDVDDDIGYAYELDILLDAGGLVEVKLDEQLNVVDVDDESRDDSSSTLSPTPSPSPSTDAVADPDDLDRAVAVALEYTGGGTVTEARLSDDADHVWEVEITFADGEDVDIELDGQFNIVKVD